MVTRGRNEVMASANVPSERHAAMSTIESILEQRPLAPIVLDMTTDDSATETVPESGHYGEKMQMTVEEGVRVYTDVYGRKPAGVEVRDERIAALAREIGRVSPERRRSLQKALRRCPLLLDSSPHARLLLESGDFDAEVAARRMAKYWEQREAMFGNRAFSDGVFTEPTYNDYCKYYDRCSRAILDPDLDDAAKEIAMSHIQAVNNAKITALDQAIDGAPALDRAAFCEAQMRAPDLVGSDEEKLLYLASEDFIEAKAAARLMRHYEFKKALLGPSLFHKQVVLADIQGDSFDNSQDMFRLSPGTDAHGRSVLSIFIARMGNGCAKEDIVKLYWYVMERAMKRESIRKNGLVVLLDYRFMTKELSDRIAPVRYLGRTIGTDCFPYKVRAIHMFMGQPQAWLTIVAPVFSVISILFKKRVVIHTGSTDEYQIAMEKYGISSDQVPQELGGGHDLDAWKLWLNRATESSA